MLNPRPARLAALAAALSLALLSGGCAATGTPQPRVIDAMYTGQYGEARQSLKQALGDDAPRPRRAHQVNRNYLLDRIRLLLATLADGYAPPHWRTIEHIYDILRTQGINRDRTVASVVINEDLKIWKGEPFEQAMALHYLALHYGMQDSWDNTRAATLASLFQLRDFGVNDAGRPLSNREVIERAARESDQVFDRYRPAKSNFTLGYLMAAIANQQMAAALGDDARAREAQEHFAEVLASRPALRELVDDLAAGDYNTLLVIDYGLGPQKLGRGPDQAIAVFEPRTASDARPVRVQVEGSDGTLMYPWVTDLNALSADARWNNLEDMRRAKSLIGNLLLVGGGATALYGLSERSEAAMLAGLGMMAAGAIAKAGAHADTRHLELLPQRVYLVPLQLAGPHEKVLVQVEGDRNSRLVLTGIEPRHDGVAELRYVRLVAGGAVYRPEWTTSGTVRYGNDRTGPLPPDEPGGHLPYILGGRDLRTPTEAVLDSYQRAGYLTDMNLSGLRELYRLEGISLSLQEEDGLPGLHVLEGGRSMAAPLGGTLGFARLFCGEHLPYQPRSPRVQQLARASREQLHAAQARQ